MIVLFITTRLIDVIMSYLSPRFVPYLGFFPYKEVFLKTQLPSFMYSFANFDGVHYIRTATMGYSQYAQAFFPLYPYLIRYSSFIFGNDPILAGLVISNVFFFIGLWIFNRYLLLLQYSKSQIKWTLIFLCLYPSSFFFGAVYNMSLFFCLVAASLYFYKKKQLFFAGITAFLAALTRLEGVLLIIPFVLPLFLKTEYKLQTKTFIALMAPIAGILTFMAFLWSTTGDPLYFLHSQAAFGANRSSSIILLPQVLYRYIKIFITASHDFRYWISVFEFSIFIFVFSVLLVDLKQLLNHKTRKHFAEELSLNIFSLCNLLLPTLTGTLSSVPRYSLMAISVFIVLAKIHNFYMKMAIAAIFFMIHVVMLMYFIQGYFVS